MFLWSQPPPLSLSSLLHICGALHPFFFFLFFKLNNHVVPLMPHHFSRINFLCMRREITLSAGVCSPFTCACCHVDTASLVFAVRRPERAGLRDKRQAAGGRAGVPALLRPAVPLPRGRADLRAPLQWRSAETRWGVRQSSAGETTGALLQGVGVWQPGQQHFLPPISR